MRLQLARHRMYIIVIILVVVILVGYSLRWNFRRAWYVLLMGNEHPDWEKLGADYFIAPWERNRFEQEKAAKGASAPTDAAGK